MAQTTLERKVLDLPSYIAGQPLRNEKKVEVYSPYTRQLVGTVSTISPSNLDQAITTMRKGGPSLSRYQRHEILEKARTLLEKRREEFVRLIAEEAGLCVFETNYEVSRSCDVLKFAAIETLKDDGQIFSCDISPMGKPRKIFTTREPLALAAAITPFNHPLNQVVHKIAPAIAVGTPLILKPSDKTPLTAIRFVETLYEAGLPEWMLSAFLGSINNVVEPMVRDERIEMLCFTGSVAIGKHIASLAGYKKLCLELGGNSPFIVLDDCDMKLAVTLAAEGSYRNSGQRCTAIKRILVQENIAEEFTKQLVAKTKEYICGNPLDPNTRVGTVIDENAAMYLESVVHDAVAQGATIQCGGSRREAIMEPTVIAGVPRSAKMVVQESFGPLAPILTIRDVDDAIALSNATAYGLSTAVATQNIENAIRIIKSVRTGTVNVNEVPGYRTELSPFGGVKDSGLGIKEGVIEAAKFMTSLKTFSLPW